MATRSPGSTPSRRNRPATGAPSRRNPRKSGRDPCKGPPSSCPLGDARPQLLEEVPRLAERSRHHCPLRYWSRGANCVGEDTIITVAGCRTSDFLLGTDGRPDSFSAPNQGARIYPWCVGPQRARRAGGAGPRDAVGPVGELCQVRSVNERRLRSLSVGRNWTARPNIRPALRARSPAGFAAQQAVKTGSFSAATDRLLPGHQARPSDGRRVPGPGGSSGIERGARGPEIRRDGGGLAGRRKRETRSDLTCPGLNLTDC